MPGETSPTTYAPLSLSHSQFVDHAHARAVESFKKNSLKADQLEEDKHFLLSREPPLDTGGELTMIRRKFLECPLQVTDDQLSRLIPLEPAMQDYKLPPGTYVIYLRTFAMPVQTFDKIVAEMEKTGAECETLQAWKKERVRFIPSDTISVRYVGATERPAETIIEAVQSEDSPQDNLRQARLRDRLRERLRRRAPWDRLASDIERALKGVKTAILQRTFFRALHRLAPEILKGAKVWIFPGFSCQITEDNGGKLQDKNCSKSTRDSKERYAIAWFDFKTLLNQDSGGTLTAFEEDEADIALFESLPTSVAMNFSCNGVPISAVQQRSLDELFSRIQQLAKTKLLASDMQFSSKFRDQIQLAATPQAVHGHVIAIFTARDTPEIDRNQGIGFRSSSGQTAMEVRQLFSSIINMELLRTDQISVSTEACNSLLCWSNISYWKYPNLMELATEIYHQYLGILAPLIVLSHGEIAMSACTSLLVSEEDDRKLLAGLGIPRLCKLPGPGNVTFIQMPTLHPGSFKYSTARRAQFRLSGLILFSTWVHMDTALNILSTISGQEMSRQELVSKILSDTESRLRKAEFYKIFDPVKREIRKIWSPAQRKAEYLEVRKLDGSQLFHKNSNSLFVFWLHPDGYEETTVLNVPQRVALASTTVKFQIFFTEFGIDIKDESGQTIYWVKKVEHAPTRHIPELRRASLDRYYWPSITNAEQRDQIVKLWEAAFHNNFTDDSNFKTALEEDKLEFAPRIASYLASKNGSTRRKQSKTTSTKPIKKHTTKPVKMTYKILIKSQQQSSAFEGLSSQTENNEPDRESSERPLKKAKLFQDDDEDEDCDDEDCDDEDGDDEDGDDEDGDDEDD